MAVKIKLKRLGRTRVPTYRIVVADARTKRDGRAIEEIGKYHPKEEPSLIEVNSERAQHWLSVGAQPTPPVMTILKITGDWQKFKGEPGSEGTLRTRETAPDKKEVFAEALKTAAKDSGDSGSTTPKGGGRGRKADSAKSEAKSESGRGRPKAGSADEFGGAVASSEAPAEEAKAAASSDAPAEEAKAAASSDAPAEEAKAAASSEAPAEEATAAASTEASASSEAPAEEATAAASSEAPAEEATAAAPDSEPGSEA